jgi:hypothetical protein
MTIMNLREQDGIVITNPASLRSRDLQFDDELSSPDGVGISKISQIETELWPPCPNFT